MTPCPSGKTIYLSERDAEQGIHKHQTNEVKRGVCKPCRTGGFLTLYQPQCSHGVWLHLGHQYPSTKTPSRRVMGPEAGGRVFNLTEVVTLGELLDPVVREQLMALVHD
jgi:hypothetical protein